jgi:hypothetical protein
MQAAKCCVCSWELVRVTCKLPSAVCAAGSLSGLHASCQVWCVQLGACQGYKAELPSAGGEGGAHLHLHLVALVLSCWGEVEGAVEGVSYPVAARGSHCGAPLAAVESDNPG